MCGCSTNVEQEKGCPYPALATPQLRMDHPCQRHAGTKTCRNKRQKGVLSDFIAYNRTAGLKCLVRYIYVYKVYEGAGSCTSPLYKYLAKKIAYNRTAGLKCLVRYIYIYVYKVYEGAGSCTSPLYKYLAKFVCVAVDCNLDFVIFAQAICK